MPTEKQKMLAGELYLATDDELVTERLRCRRLLRELNNSDPADEVGRRGILALLLGGFPETAWIEPPFQCDYGSNIFVGARFYANFDCVMLDAGRIDIGDDVLFGPGVHVYTASHPIESRERIKGPELGKAVRIGARTWVGGRSIILPGVTVGEGVTIGAGSVVTRDIPANVLAAGNPCRVIRELP